MSLSYRFSRTRSAAVLGIALAAATTAVSVPALAPPSVSAATTRVSSIVLADGSTRTLTTPADLAVSVYARGLPSARFMALGPRGDVFVGSWTAGTVSVLLNRTSGKQAAQVKTLLRGLTVPHGVAYNKGLLYVGEEGQVSSYQYNAANASLSNRTVVVPHLPTGGRHVTRTVAIGPDKMLYVTVGSSCNECVDEATRALVMRYKLDGSGGTVFASGLRNTVGIAWQPKTGRLFGADNGRDFLGENLPPDEIDLLQQGGVYGWPYCYGAGLADPLLSSASGYCARTIEPARSLQAHSAPLGVAYGTGTLAPARYRRGIFVAYHGSAYRSRLTGYKVVYIQIDGATVGTPQDVVTGWLAGSTFWGRPVGLLVAADGSLLVSDDDVGVVYRVALVGR